MSEQLSISPHQERCFAAVQCYVSWGERPYIRRPDGSCGEILLCFQLKSIFSCPTLRVSQSQREDGTPLSSDFWTTRPS